MISPDELAAGMLPPVESSAPATLVHHVADAGMALAEQLQTLPAGRYRRVAESHLVRALQAAYVGMEPVLVPKGAEDEPVPYTVTETTAATAEPDPDSAACDMPDLDLWVLGIRTSGLHPLSRLVALTLAQSARPSGRIPAADQPTLTQLAARTGLHLHAVHTHLGDLVATGWVTRYRGLDRHGAVSSFRLRMPAYNR